jgi:hypothetical protein
MKAPDWKALHAIVDQLRRDYEALQGINDPDRFTAAYEEIWRLKMELLHEADAGQLAQRLGVARISRSPFELTPSWLPESEAAGREPVAPLSAMDTDEAATQRRIVQFVNMVADSMPPGLSTNMAAALIVLNLGFVMPLLAPLKIQGLPRNAGSKAILFVFFALGVYYRAGYSGRPLEEVFRKNCALVDDMTYNAFHKQIRKLVLQGVLNQVRGEGQADARAGKPMRPEWCGDYDIRALAEIRHEDETGSKIVPFGKR